MKAFLRILCIVLVASPMARAAVRQSDANAGTLLFSATQAGAKFTGAFKSFRVSLDFDPANPSKGSLDVSVETPSIDTQDAERDEILKGRDFFWTAKYPQAVFHAERFEPDGAGFRAVGELSIRGAKKPATVRFSLAPAAGVSVMKGTANLRRLDFGLGQGDWASTEWVGDKVEVRFELKLRPVSPATIS